MRGGEDLKHPFGWGDAGAVNVVERGGGGEGVGIDCHGVGLGAGASPGDPRYGVV